MAATLTTTAAMLGPYASFGGSPGPSVRTYTLDWLSHTDGTVDLDTDGAIVGEILRVTFVPNGGGTAPSNAYDVLLKDAHGIDVLGGQGANLSSSAASSLCPGVPLKDGATTSVVPVAVAGVLNLEVANAGSGKGGLVVIYVR
jgi:hypothetical protein